MSKEIESLKRIETTFSMNKQGKESVYIEYTNSVYPYYEDFDLVLKALRRLESIDNANPSEALEDLKELHELAYGVDGWKIDEIRMSSHIKQALQKAQEQEKENELLKGQMKYLTEVVTEFQKGIRIINEKNVDISYLKYDCHFELCLYNKYMEDSKQLTQEELDLLKMTYI